MYDTRGMEVETTAKSVESPRVEAVFSQETIPLENKSFSFEKAKVCMEQCISLVLD
jgi:hypothetical protein